MSDIVERLLDEVGQGNGPVMLSPGTVRAAASEITRLSAELANCRASALDEAAKVADGTTYGSPKSIAKAIRALSPSPAAPSSPVALGQSEPPPGSAGQG